MSALNEDAPVSDGNNHAYVMDLREIFIHVCGDRAIDRAYKLARLTGDTGNGDCYFKFWLLHDNLRTPRDERRKE